MPVSQELLEILVCPETKQPVAPASEEIIANVNQRISSGGLRNRGGDPVEKPVILKHCRILTEDLADGGIRF